MSQYEDTAAGMQLAYGLLLSAADEDREAALVAINTASEGEAKQALAYLLAIAVEQAALVGRHHRPRMTASELLRAAADGVAEDITVTIAAQIIQNAERSI